MNSSSDLQSHYESLRAGVLAKNLRATRGLGYSVLVYQGLASWVLTWLRASTMVPLTPAPIRTVPCPPAVDKVVLVLAEMALRIYSEPRNAS